MADTTALVPVFSGVISNTTVQLCDARALHTFMQVRRDFTTWIKGRITKFGFVAGEDFITAAKLDSPDLVNQVGHGGDRRSIEYHLTLDMAKELAMVENNAQGRAARKYFIACERKLMAAPQPALPYGVQPGDKLSRQQQDELRALLERAAEKLPAPKRGAFLASGWSKLRKHTGVHYRQIPQAAHTDALSLLARHVAEWEVVDDTPPAAQAHAGLHPFERRAMQHAQTNAVAYMREWREQHAQGKNDPVEMPAIPADVLAGLVAEAMMNQRWLVAYNDQYGGLLAQPVGQSEFVASWPKLVNGIETGKCRRTNAELLDMAAACMQRLQQRGGASRMTA